MSIPNSEVPNDTKHSKGVKRKLPQKERCNSDNELEGNKDEKENPFDFYKFAEQTAEEIKRVPEVNENGTPCYAPPPRWLNKRPKITYSSMCAMAIQVNILSIPQK